MQRLAFLWWPVHAALGATWDEYIQGLGLAGQPRGVTREDALARAEQALARMRQGWTVEVAADGE
ncbi:MAG: hypothetical protein AB1609_22670 [Bacillota bacterium]